MRWTPQYHTACQIQKRILGQMESPELTPKDLAALTRAWDDLENRKRILRMKPLPKSIDVTPKEKPRAAVTFKE